MRLFQSITLFFALAFLLSCQKYKSIEPDFDRSGTDYLVETTDDASLAANLPILRELPLDVELTEIRIWVGFGPIILEHFFSINLTNKVSGKMIWYFHPPWKQWSEQDYLDFKTEFYQYCEKLGVYKETEACLDKDYVFDWNGIHNELVALDIWNIPDESEVPKYVNKDSITSTDGTSVVVELKKPGYYRSFSYRYEHVVYKDKYLYANKILNILRKYSR